MVEMANNSDVSGDSPAANTAAVRWESFLPKRVLRVLLVEADDSTRHIITILLKKCSYKVAAVSDGLKAWEVLNGRPQSFDLILTEVELPSISGYPLLTLIMEHEICKNIPVIMMSAQDSVSTVYKCMLKGASDFLVKPLRKNELRNLWQHVWRRQAQSSSGEPGPLEESTALQKIEVTAENNANNSCDLVCIQKNREFIEKGNDAQSSSKPVLDAGGVEVECALGLLTNININKHESYPITDKKVQSLDFVAEESKEPTGLNAQDSESVREVIDLIGAFDNYLKRSRRTSGTNVAASNLVDPLPELDLSLKRDSSSVSVDEVTEEKNTNVAASNLVDPLPELDLSLKRDSSSVSVDEVTEEKNMLNHSESSPFSRYVNRNVQPQHPLSPASCSQQKDQKSNSDFSISLLEETKIPFSQHRLLSAPVAVRGGITLDNKSPLFHTEAELAAAQKAYFKFSLPPLSQMDKNYSGDMAVDQNEDMEKQKMDNISSATDHSASSSFCTGIVNNFQNLLNVGKEKVDAAIFLSPSEFRVPAEGSSTRAVQRAAALEKFRMKRKDRCFEKKVRYESRQKLAEKRPRVKGQFVRQAAEGSSSPAE